jgi:hypothetical protein
MTMKFLPSGLGDGLGAGLVWGLGAGLVAGADLESGPISLWLNPMTIPLRFGSGAAAGAVRPVCPTTNACSGSGAGCVSSAPITIFLGGGGGAGAPEKKVAC